jgi:hypothetical protein
MSPEQATKLGAAFTFEIIHEAYSGIEGRMMNE